MVILTLNLTPPLTGVVGDVYYIYGGTYYFLFPLVESSTNGLIQVYFGDAPDYDFVVIFPEQSVEGIAVRATETKKFKLTSDVTVNVVLNTEAPPIQASMGILALITLIGLMIFKKPKK